jgi:hypothetical protein
MDPQRTDTSFCSYCRNLNEIRHWSNYNVTLAIYWLKLFCCDLRWEIRRKKENISHDRILVTPFHKTFIYWDGNNWVFYLRKFCSNKAQNAWEYINPWRWHPMYIQRTTASGLKSISGQLDCPWTSFGSPMGTWENTGISAENYSGSSISHPYTSEANLSIILSIR